MFGQDKRPRLPWGHLIPSGKIWQGISTRGCAWSIAAGHE
jgi:hypothetical protein